MSTKLIVKNDRIDFVIELERFLTRTVGSKEYKLHYSTTTKGEHIFYSALIVY